MNDSSAAQRELLLGLLALQRKQEQALVVGDLATLCRLSEVRLRMVREASSVLLPRVSWAPDLLGLVGELRQRTADLEQALRTRTETLRRQMVRLTEGRRVAEYFAPAVPRRTQDWTA